MKSDFRRQNYCNSSSSLLFLLLNNHMFAFPHVFTNFLPLNQQLSKNSFTWRNTFYFTVIYYIKDKYRIIVWHYLQFSSALIKLSGIYADLFESELSRAEKKNIVGRKFYLHAVLFIKFACVPLIFYR